MTTFKLHELKLLYEFQEPILSGAKRFEIRKNDRDYHVGDLLHFNTVDRKQIVEPIEQQIYVITYILSGWHIEEGYAVLGIDMSVDMRGL
jgi:uncharacterized protein YqfB (UPF0267 family)